MKIKNAMNSEECKDIRKVLALANELKKNADRLAAFDNAPSEMQSVCVKLAQVQTLLCTMFGAKLDETLQLAQECEAEDGQEITYLSRQSQRSHKTKRLQKQANKRLNAEICAPSGFPDVG